MGPPDHGDQPGCCERQTPEMHLPAADQSSRDMRRAARRSCQKTVCPIKHGHASTDPAFRMRAGLVIWLLVAATGLIAASIPQQAAPPATRLRAVQATLQASHSRPIMRAELLRKMHPPG